MAAGPLEDVVAHVNSDQPQIDTPAAVTPPVTEPDPDDLDAKELAEALKAAEAEKASGQNPPANPEAPPPGEAETGQQQQPNPPATETPKEKPEGQQPVPMIPKPRLDEVLREKDEALQKAAYLQGQLEATQAMLKTGQPAAPQQPATPPPPTPEQRLAQVHQAQDALAAKFDSGEITFAQLNQEKRKLDNFEADIRKGQLLAEVKAATPQPPQPQQGETLYLDTLTAQLETENPWVLEFKDESDFNFIVGKAKASLQEKGVQLDNSDIGKYHLRKEIAEKATEWGPRFYPDKQVGTASTTPATPPAPSAAATARANKLDIAANMPPDLSAVSGTGGPAAQGDYSAARIEQMSDEEIAALTPSVRNKFLGITSN